MPDIHLKYGGSTARRTLNCPAWHNLAEKAPKIERSSAAAERGTFLHGLMEAIYNEEMSLETAKERAGEDAEAIEIAYNATEDFLDSLGEVDFVNEAFLQIPGTEIGGSSDMLIATPDRVVILDYKFGYQPVEHREQFLLYDYAGSESKDHGDMFWTDDNLLKPMTSVIIQPAVSEQPLVVEHTVEELEAFAEDFDAAVDISESGNEDGDPGDWCQYCPAALYCPAKRQQAANFITLDPKVKEDLAAAMAMVGDMKEHIRAVEAEVFACLEAGHEVPGWKLVLKQTRRYWSDEDKVRHLLRYNKGVTKDMYIEEKLKSVAQVEKALKPNGGLGGLEQYVENRASGTTIAPESDKRPAIKRSQEMPEALAELYGK